MPIPLKFTTKLGVLLLFLCAFTSVNAQDQHLKKDSATTESEMTSIKTDNFQPYKVDGVAAVVGDYIILISDIKKFRTDIENRMSNSADFTDCELLGRLMEDKLFSHAAMQDTTVAETVTDAQVKRQVDQQIQRLLRRVGSMDQLLKFYRKDSEKEIRDALFKIDKENQLASAMRNNITESVEITPEEVHQYFENIPEDERPRFGDEVEIAQLTIKPKVTQAQIDKVVARLNEMRDDILNGNSSFATKAVLYSEGSTSTRGGKMMITRKDPLDQDFKQVAFSLREGEISKPFKSSFGFHIIKVEKILGQKRQIRHIILIPDVTDETLAAARERIDSIRTLITSDSLSFALAAKKFSDDKDTRSEGGQMINSQTGDTYFEMTKIDPRIYNEVNNLDEGEVSSILTGETPRTGEKYFRIITVTGKYPAHVADYTKDYTKIKELALKHKQFEAVKKWRDKEINNSYIKVSDAYKDCVFESNWLKK